MTKELWTNQWQRILAVAGAALGAIFLIVGWFGVSGSDLTTEQIPYLASGGVGGLFLLGLAATLWLSADLRDEYLKLDDIHQVVEHLGNGGHSHGVTQLASDAGDREPELASAMSSPDNHEDDDTTPPRSRPLRTRKG